MVQEQVSSFRSARFSRLSWALCAVLVVALVGVLAYRYNEHRVHIAALTVARDYARSLAAATKKSAGELDSVAGPYSTKISAIFNSLDGIETNGIGYVAVVRERISDQLNDATLTRALSHVPPRISADGEFTKRRAEFEAAYGAARDQLTSFSAMLGTVLNNPFLAIGMTQEDGFAIGQRVGRAERKLADGWVALRTRARTVADDSARDAKSADQQRAAVANESLFKALLDP